MESPVAEATKKLQPTRLVRVMHVIHSIDVGGAEQVVANYARHIDKTRFSTSVCALRAGGRLYDQLRDEGVRTFLLRKRSGADLGALRRLVRLIKSEGIDILHTHNASAHSWGLLAAVLSTKPILVATEHSIHFPGRGGKLYSLARHAFRQRFSSIISCCNQVRDTQIPPWRLPANKHVVIHNGINPSLYASTPQQSLIVEKLGLDPARPIVGTVGSLTPHKGHSVLIEAVAKMRRRGHTPQVLIIGDGPLRTELAENISQNGLNGQILLAGVRVNISEILPLLDIFVLPSLREGFPISILEAMAAGLPVVASDVGGCRESLVDGVTGFLSEPGDPDMLADLLSELLADSARRLSMGKAAQERVRSHFSVEGMVRATERLYDSLVNGHDAASSQNGKRNNILPLPFRDMRRDSGRSQP